MPLSPDSTPLASKPPAISVVIPSYNCAHYVTQAVDSALAQSVPVDEIIVVDNGSSDDTPQVLARYGDRVRYAFQPNRGISNARNRGISMARGELIAFLDADDVWLPEKLEKQLQCLAANPEAGLVHTDILHWDDRTGELQHRPQGRERFVGRCKREFFWHCRVHTSSVLVTRRCLEAVGSFDESIPGGYAEDLDLFQRIARQFALAFVPEPLVHYRQHDHNATLNALRMAESNFYVYRRALMADPELWTMLGRKAVRSYLQHLAFMAGYTNAEAGELRRARDYFGSAVSYGPTSPYLWMLWGSTFVPLSMRQWLRSLKQRVA